MAIEEIGHFSPQAADAFSTAFTLAARDAAEHPYRDRLFGRFRERSLSQFNRRFLYLVNEGRDEVWIMHLLGSDSAANDISKD